VVNRIKVAGARRRGWAGVAPRPHARGGPETAAGSRLAGATISSRGAAGRRCITSCGLALVFPALCHAADISLRGGSLWRHLRRSRRPPRFEGGSDRGLGLS